jgi:Matrixin
MRGSNAVRAGAGRQSKPALVISLAGAATAVALTSASPASAYCLTASCSEPGVGKVCTPMEPDDCGVAIGWRTPCIGYSVQKDASAQISLAVAEEVFSTAFATWMNVDCGGGAHPRIQVGYAGAIACALHEYNMELGNANAIIFRDADWPYAGMTSTLALTTVTYNLDNGDIYDADIEFNSSSSEITFTTGDTDVQFDLRSIATHEIGHFLGLSHTSVDDATMTPGYEPGSTDLRTLAQDDIDALCAAYPSGDIPAAECDSTPRHGFSGECSADQEPVDDDTGCCSVAPGGQSKGSRRGALALGFGGILLCAARLRRKFARSH